MEIVSRALVFRNFGLERKRYNNLGNACGTTSGNIVLESWGRVYLEVVSRTLVFASVTSYRRFLFFKPGVFSLNMSLPLLKKARRCLKNRPQGAPAQRLGVHNGDQSTPAGPELTTRRFGGQN